MNHNLLWRLALSNTKKNKQILIPYLLVSTVTVMIYYILYSLARCPFICKDKVEAFYGAETITMFLMIGSEIVAIFAFIFLLYANRFVMKERKREMGLYGILGLSKKNMATLLGLETLIYSLVSVVIGIIIGTILNKLMLLWLYKILKLPVVSGFFISGQAIIATIVLFFAIFGFCMIYNVFSISIANPIDLLKSNKVGEKEPKVKWPFVLLGVICIAGGYYLALSCKTTMSALTYFFNAVLLVIIGTYCLFTAGTIFVLKLLKNKKSYYYKTRHFISISNLMYRMKHNAAGLASICVLSTAVIILLSCASTLMALGEKNIEMNFPKDVKVVVADNNKEQYVEKLIKVAEKNKIQYVNPVGYYYKELTAMKSETGFLAVEVNKIDNYDMLAQVYMISLEEYKEHVNLEVTLAENEVLLLNSSNRVEKNIVLGTETFDIVGNVELSALTPITNISMSLFESCYIVFANEEVMNEAFNQLIEKEEGMLAQGNCILVGFDTKEKLSKEQMAEITQAFDLSATGILTDVGFKQEDEVFFFNTYGGVFFVGIFLAVLFLLATVMIIFYKQMSEGMEDQRRYQILKNIGLTDAEVQATIKSQVRLVFFLPVVTAIIHMIFASNIVRLFLGMILLVDETTFIMAIAAVAVIFFLVYVVVYRLTSIEYYKKANGYGA